MKSLCWNGIGPRAGEWFVVAALAAGVLGSTGCMTAAQHQAALGSSTEREMTLGVVQKEIRPGMSQADVAIALGSPNIVTKDGDGHETWIYDKIATEASYSNDSGGVFLILGGYNKSAGASSTTQKTLTVVLKFDDAQKVTTVSYHASKF